jgi:hypothetical protein
MRTARLVVAAIAAMTICFPAQAQVAVATYEFNNSYAADQAGVVALNPYAPGAGTLSFVTDTVNVGTQSVTRPVLVRNSSGPPVSQPNQAGVELNTTGLLTNSNIYSVEVVFSINSNSATYQKLVNTVNNQDYGLYLANGKLDIYDPAQGGDHFGSAPFTAGPSTYHHLVLTDDGQASNRGSVYLDGSLETSLVPTNTTLNPNNFMRFFLDDLAGSQSESGPGRVALIRLYDGVLTPSEISTLAAAPFAVPEPGTLILTGLAAAGGMFGARRRRGRSI